MYVITHHYEINSAKKRKKSCYQCTDDIFWKERQIIIYIALLRCNYRDEIQIQQLHKLVISSKTVIVFL